ncbi:hypothetical protein Q5752_006179 [Cryptotrichosporon argae]
MSNITQGVKDFLKGSHKADTTEVCTETAPEVVQEQVRPTEHTTTAEAVDRERHVHHHQHRVQPIEDHVTLPTQHVEATAPVVTREHKHEMLPEHQAKLQEQRAAYQDQVVTGDVERTAEHVGVHANEHQHHHIHETIQPVIQRETIQPTHVHHTVAVHEKIHDAPIVHEATTLPTIQHSDFLKQKEVGGVQHHGDSTHQHQFYEGAPRVGGARDTTA